ncbi:MAG: hypothetical protein JJT96_08440 [Opitutales bacterium]|nr:hypothetical protein [Opitutales bacterium]
MMNPLDREERESPTSTSEEVDEATRQEAERAVRWILLVAAVFILLPLILGVLFLR